MRRVPQFEVSRKATWLKSFSQAMTSLVGQHEAPAEGAPVISARLTPYQQREHPLFQ